MVRGYGSSLPMFDCLFRFFIHMRSVDVRKFWVPLTCLFTVAAITAERNHSNFPQCNKKDRLVLPIIQSRIFEHSNYVTAIRIFNRLSTVIKRLNGKKFKGHLKKRLIYNVFYNLNDFYKKTSSIRQLCLILFYGHLNCGIFYVNFNNCNCKDIVRPTWVRTVNNIEYKYYVTPLFYQFTQ